jgi:hypothetical protein
MKHTIKSPGMRLFKTIGLVLTLGVSMTACSQTTWKEEVLLHDGSKIMVTRWQSRGGRGEVGQSPIKEQAISFVLPGTSKPVTWKDEYSEDVGHSNFDLLAVHILNGTAYIATSTYGCLAYNKWGRPNPPYVFFRYDKSAWLRITLPEFPAVFKEINVVINSSSHEKKMIEESRQSGYVSAATIKKLNSSMTQPEYQTILRAPVKREGLEGCPEMVRVDGGWVSPGNSIGKRMMDQQLNKSK